jgi:tRNA U34 5-carboxymethylaminomethyl modifying enzyme MnmG/GidA
LPNWCFSKFQFKAGVQEVYEYILQSLFKSKSGEKNANKQALQVEIDKNKERLNKAQQMMLDGEIEMADYKEIKRNLEPKIEAMLTQQLSFNQIEVEYRGYLKKGLTAIKNLGHLFDNASINGKIKRFVFADLLRGRAFRRR